MMIGGYSQGIVRNKTSHIECMDRRTTTVKLRRYILQGLPLITVTLIVHVGISLLALLK